MTTPPCVEVLVCGNTDRADDGAAIRAAGALLAQRADRRHHVNFVRCGQLDVQHLLDVPFGHAVVIVDTASGIRPGRVVTVPLDDLIDNPTAPAPRSSHALPINQVLGVANVLAGEPLRGVFVGIGGADFGYHDGLSPAVKRGLHRFVRAIGEAIDAHSPRPAETGRGR